VVDLETGQQEMPAGEAGEIIIKGPQVMKAAVIRDGWLYTGDIGVIDEEGYVSIVDRKKDIIIAGGFNIYPNEIDDVLFAHPKIAEACTIGVTDEYRGETVKAYIVLNEGENLTLNEIQDYCKSSLAPYKIPKHVEFIDTLPKSGVGKILRRVLKEMDAEKSETVRS
jgi:long-chain acyl-CoA synthetase